MIEYDGEQHFQCRGNGWNTKEHLEKTQKRDVFKSNWAEKNNIPLLRISYKEKNIEKLIMNFLNRGGDYNE